MSPWFLGSAVALGAVFGALVRWGAALLFNPVWGGFPLGTLVVNAVGGLLAGMAFVAFSRYPHEPLRLLLVTGFLGGLTTFSSFSAESLSLLEKGRFDLAAFHTSAHVLGALACAAVGARAMRWYLA
ncbi:CrcB family protein [Aquabacterium sp.]|uniref:CrcB family protein n=1 Tax=Aquabacterium sp. TaxID=1872578 RepID=UPI003D6CB0AB